MPEVEYEIKDSIAYITLNRPEKLNAMNPRMLQLLREAFEDLEYNPEARVAIVTGMGRAFSTGLDLTAMTPRRGAGGQEHLGPVRSPAEYLETHHIRHQRSLPGPGLRTGPGRGYKNRIGGCPVRLAPGKPESTEGRPWGQPLKKPEGAPLNLG